MSEPKTIAADEFIKRAKRPDITSEGWRKTQEIESRLEQEVAVLNNIISDLCVDKEAGVEKTPIITVSADEASETAGTINVTAEYIVMHENRHIQILDIVPQASDKVDVYLYKTDSHHYRKITLDYDLDKLARLMGRHASYFLKRDPVSAFFSSQLAKPETSPA